MTICIGQHAVGSVRSWVKPDNVCVFLLVSLTPLKAGGRPVDTRVGATASARFAMLCGAREWSPPLAPHRKPHSAVAA